MSALSVTHSPTRWIPDSPRRKPRATTTVAAAPPQIQPANTTSAEVTSARAAVMDDVARNMHNTKCGDGDGGQKTQACGSRISFAPGTTFHDRTRVRSRGSSKKVPATFNFRPITPGEKPQTPQLRFKLPKATLPSLHYLSVSQEDFLDPRYAQDIVKTYGIPKYLFKSKSTLLTSAGKLRGGPAVVGGAVVHTRLGAAPSEDDKQKQSITLGKEGDDGRPKTSGEMSATRGLPQRFNVVPMGMGNTEATYDRGHFDVGELGGRKEEEECEADPRNRVPAVAPVYKPLIGEKYTHARFFPPMNPYRSLQLESEVTKYVQHKKRVGLGRYVEFAEADSAPNSALVREASMYDLNREGPVERPLDGFLPPPDRKPFIRQRPRDPKNDFVRCTDDRDLIIMPRDRSATDKDTDLAKDAARR